MRRRVGGMSCRTSGEVVPSSRQLLCNQSNSTLVPPEMMAPCWFSVTRVCACVCKLASPAGLLECGAL